LGFVHNHKKEMIDPVPGSGYIQSTGSIGKNLIGHADHRSAMFSVRHAGQYATGFHGALNASKGNVSMKKMFITLFGKAFYRNYVTFTTDLYHSACLNLKEDGMGLIPGLIPQDGVVFDIGANIGQFTRLAAKSVGEKGRVFAFEPGSESRRVLSAMIRLKRHRNVTIVDKALSNTNAKQRIAIPLKEGWKPMLGLAHLDQKNTGDDDADMLYETVNLTNIDDYCSINRISALDFIKCDTEGSELKIFQGARQSIMNFKPPVFCEIEKNHCDRYGIDPSEIFDLFRGFGYAAFLPMEYEKGITWVEDYVKPCNYFFFHLSRLDSVKSRVLVRYP
jgi:FkbM family methyltransferase